MHCSELNDPAFAAWFTSLMRPDGMGLCCNQVDCDCAVEWDIRDGVYWVRLPSMPEALPVDPKYILKRYDNPTGKVVACEIAGQIRCMVGAAGT
jgi:hypothetical protein